MCSQPDFSLTLFQKSFLFLHYLDPTGGGFTIGRVYRLAGPIDRDKLRSAFGIVLDRHPLLRSALAVAAGTPFWTSKQFRFGDITYLSLANVRPAERPHQLNETLKVEFDRPFDLGSPPLVRVVQIKQSEDDHVLLVAMPHIITDDHAISLFVGAMGKAYSNLIEGKAHEAKTDDGFCDYALAEANCAGTGDWAAALDYWRDNLASVPPFLGLPKVEDGSNIGPYAGAEAQFALAPGLADRVNVASRRFGITPYALYLAAYGRALQALCKGQEVVIGGLIANRLTLPAKLMMGPRVNTLPLRLHPGAPNACYLRDVQRTVHCAYRTSHVPIEFVIQELKRSGLLAREAHFEAIFDYSAVSLATPTFSGLTMTLMEHPRRRSQVPIILKISPVGDTTQVSLRYQLKHFDVGGINRLFALYQSSIEELSASAFSPPKSEQLERGQ